MHLKVNIFIVLLTLWDPILSSKSKLRKDLLQNYTKELPPNNTLKVNLYFSSFHTNNIIDFDDRDGKFTVSGYIEVSWIDPRIALNWASSPNFQNDFFSMQFKDSDVWTPQIRQIDPYSRFDFEKMVEEIVTFQRDGSALMIKMDVFTVKCKGNFYYFPFDKQKCRVDMVVWEFFVEIDLKARISEVDATLYAENNAWNLEDTRISVDSIVYGSKGKSKFQRAKVEFTIKRNSSYYVFFLIVPFIELQLLQPFVFWMPWDCGERIGFSLTLLLAMAVYLTIVAEQIPKSSESELSLLGIKMVLDLCFAASFQIFVIVIHVIYSNSGRSERSELNVCELSKDSGNTSPRSEENMNSGQNKDWISHGKKIDIKCFAVSFSIMLSSALYTGVMYGESE